MLFFVDESFQRVGGVDVGSLGVVAIPDENYNRFCGWVFKIKREQLGAQELLECELKGSNCFAKAAFTYEASGQRSSLLESVELVQEGLVRNGAIIFALWTRRPELLSLRNTTSNNLTGPYIMLLKTFAHYVQSRKTHERGLLFLDQLGHKQDMHAATTLQNYMARTDDRMFLQRNLIQVPHYTHSAVSPGLQVADLVAYLAAQRNDPSHRPELDDWWKRFAALGRYEFGALDLETGSRGERITVGPFRPPQRRRRRGPAGRRP